MGTPSWEMEKVETATPNGGEAGPELTTVYLLSGLWLVLTYRPRKPPYEGEDHLVICLGYHTVGKYINEQSNSTPSSTLQPSTRMSFSVNMQEFQMNILSLISC